MQKVTCNPCNKQLLVTQKKKVKYSMQQAVFSHLKI